MSHLTIENDSETSESDSQYLEKLRMFTKDIREDFEKSLKEYPIMEKLLDELDKLYDDHNRNILKEFAKVGHIRYHVSDLLFELRQVVNRAFGFIDTPTTQHLFNEVIGDVAKCKSNEFWVQQVIKGGDNQFPIIFKVTNLLYEFYMTLNVVIRKINDYP